MEHQGGCHCGALRYSIGAPLADIAHCHCATCRRTTGGIAVTWATVPRNAFRWVRGVPAAYRSSNHAQRFHCRRCGGQVALWTSKAPLTMDITVATLDHPEAHPATRHIWTSSRLPWLHLDEDLPGEPEETY